jgi:hypothetical protein
VRADRTTPGSLIKSSEIIKGDMKAPALPYWRLADLPGGRHKSMNQKLGRLRRKKGLRQHSTLQDNLERQIRYLKRSCALFDAGHEDEAQRIAVALRVLLHHTTQSKSLLMQLGLQTTSRFVDTALYREELDRAYDRWVEQVTPGMVIAGTTPDEAGLVVEGINSSGNPAWVAPLATPRLPPAHPAAASTIGVVKSFDPWWTTPVVETGSLNYLSRENLITIMANEDGGARVDPELDTEYEQLTVDSLGWQTKIGETVSDKTMVTDTIPDLQGNVAAASVRQIAFEVLQTLRPEEDHSGTVQRIHGGTTIMVTPIKSPDQ